jgi:hypothetical protein
MGTASRPPQSRPGDHGSSGQVTTASEKRAYHYRAKDGVEVDAVIETPDGRIPDQQPFGDSCRSVFFHVISADITCGRGGTMTDLLIREVPDDVVASIDANASRLGIFSK